MDKNLTVDVRVIEDDVLSINTSDDEILSVGTTNDLVVSLNVEDDEVLSLNTVIEKPVTVKAGGIKYVKSHLQDADANPEDVLVGKTFYSRNSAFRQEGTLDPGIYAPIQSISKNGKLIEPDENKNVNITLDKEDVGLNNVDNTSDIDKPISEAARKEFHTLNIKLTETGNRLSTRIDNQELSIKKLQNNIDTKIRTVSTIPQDMKANDYIFLKV